MYLTRAVVIGALTTTLLAGCSLIPRSGEAAPERADDLHPLQLTDSLTDAGAQRVRASGLTDNAPRYHVTAAVTPESGRVTGTVRAALPVGADAREVQLRYFAGLPAFEAKAGLGDVTVDGLPASTKRQASIVTVRLPRTHGDRVRLTVPFSYTLGTADEGGGLLDGLTGGLSPADVGLLSRHRDVLNLGHWFPLWVPEGSSDQPVPDGFGDIGNFPAAMFSLELTVPDGWTVIDGGVRVDEQAEDGQLTIRSEGAGMRDLVVSVVQGYDRVQRRLGGKLSGVTVSVYGPAGADGVLGAVLDESVAPVRALSEALGAYPWRELEVVSAPLGSGVGGMEWPGAVWIESSLFAGGVPGLGGLGALGELPEGGLFAELGLMMQTLRQWTVAHEVGHQWWHILVGNDSVQHPVVDEPLAQYSACLALRESPAVAVQVAAVCDAHIESAYTQMRMLGTPDTRAAQRSDAFQSSTQYGGVVYGKAAAFYLALDEEFGQAAVRDALAAVVDEHAFTMLSAGELRRTLGQELGATDRFRAMWRHWMVERHGDADLGTSLFGGDDGSGGGGDRSGDGGGSGRQEMQRMLEQLLDDALDDALGGQ